MRSKNLMFSEMFRLFCVVTVLQSCGYPPPAPAPTPAGKGYTWDTAKKDCLGCHNPAQWPFMASEQAFKSNPGVLNVVVSGRMPKGSPYTPAKIEEFKVYYNKK